MGEKQCRESYTVHSGIRTHDPHDCFTGGDLGLVEGELGMVLKFSLQGNYLVTGKVSGGLKRSSKRRL